ncbi:MAG: hypothetical protein IRZ16_18000 [Myxococcaceae bacterium]|nr:hypothetical protein [Myxococcaceae bacterium]
MSMEAKDKRAHAEEVLSEVLKRMGVQARLEVKELAATEATADRPATPASISVALFPEGDTPGLTVGKRSPVADALQFLANKIVNRGPDKKWINLGVGAHPEPRQPKPPPQPAPAAPPAQAAAPAPQRPQKPAKKAGKAADQKGPEQPDRERPPEIDESKLEVPENPALMRLGRALAEKAAQFGRFYAVLPTSPVERVNLRNGAVGVNDVSVKFDGEGRHRRAVFVPSNPKPMPKKSVMPDYDDEEDLDEE